MQSSDVISEGMQRVLERELRPGERVLWSEQPRPLALARKSSKSFLFGIPFFAFAVFWTILASGGLSSRKNKTGPFAGWFPILWGSMFIAVGAGLLLSP